MSKWAGDFPEDFTTVPIFFGTNDGAGGAVAPSSAFEVADFKIFKNGSDVEKTTTNGLSIASPMNAHTGLHRLLIDTSNDTGDSGFWTAGAVYTVVLVPDETVDGQTVVAPVGQFSVGMIHRADVRQAGGTDLIRQLQAGGTATMTLAATEPTADGAYVNWRFWTVSGAGASQFFRITAYDGDTQVATVVLDATGVATAVATDNTTTYILYEPGGTGSGGGLTAAETRDALGLAAANLDTQLSTIDTVVDAVKAKTDALPTDPADQSLVIAATTAITTLIGTPAGASVSADVAAVKTDTATLLTRITSTLFTGVTSLAQWLGLIAGKQTGNTTARTELRATGAGGGTYDETTDSMEAVRDAQAWDSEAVARFNRNAQGVTLGTVGTGSSATSIVTSSLNPAATVTDQFKGKILTFTYNTATAALRGQSTDITASSNTGVLTVTALTTAPASTDSFSIA